MVIKGYKRRLEFHDLWGLRLEDTSKVIVKTFLGMWNQELERTGFCPRYVSVRDYYLHKKLYD